MVIIISKYSYIQLNRIWYHSLDFSILTIFFDFERKTINVVKMPILPNYPSNFGQMVMGIDGVGPQY